MEEKLIELITEEVIRQLRLHGNVILPSSGNESYAGRTEPDCQQMFTLSRSDTTLDITEDITSAEAKEKILIKNPMDREAIVRMKKRTTARIAAGNTGARLNTRSLLTLRADHAKARDAVLKDVDPALIEQMGLFQIQTQCEDKNTFITRPDLGRKLNRESVEILKSRCIQKPDVQIYVADGLSSSAVEANTDKILPVLEEGLRAKGLKTGTPFYMRFGRVAAEDEVAEITGAGVVCVLLGERPGLATAESMSAYIVYNSYVGIPESKRTVVSNIHKNGLSAVEAGAYIVEVISQILAARASGVDLVK